MTWLLSHQGRGHRWHWDPGLLSQQPHHIVSVCWASRTETEGGCRIRCGKSGADKPPWQLYHMIHVATSTATLNSSDVFLNIHGSRSSGAFQNRTGGARKPAHARSLAETVSCDPILNARISNMSKVILQQIFPRERKLSLSQTPVKYRHKSPNYHLDGLRNYYQILWSAWNFLVLWTRSRILYLI